MVLHAPRGSAPHVAEEAAEAAPSAEEDLVIFAPPSEGVMAYYVMVKKSPRELFKGSEFFIAKDLEAAKKQAVEIVFGTGLPCTDDEILERYNVELVELDDEWERKVQEYTQRCLAPSLE